MKTRLTVKRLLAIQEALSFRLAGPIDVDEDNNLTKEDYDAAFSWAVEEETKRTKYKK